MCFDKYVAKDRISSMGPKRSIETNFSKNSCFHDDKSFWPFFRRLNECDKPRGTFHIGPQPILIFTVELIRVFF